MLHILLLILKIIGIILAVILGILVLLVCIVLFAPVRYEADAICRDGIGSLKAKVTVTWLFHLIKAEVYYKEKKARWRVRVAWKKFTGGERFGDTADKEKLKEVKKDEEKDEKDAEQKETQISEEPEKLREEKDDEEASKEREENEKSVEEAKPGMEEESRESGRDCEKDSAYGSETSFNRSEESGGFGKESSNRSAESGKESESGTQKGESIQRIIKRVIRGIIDKLKGLRKKIENICRKIEELLEKKEKLTDFITDETHVGAFVKVKNEAFRILRSLKPNELRAKARFGFENPQRTGQALAFLAVLYPFTEENLEVIPDFEHKVLKGKVHIKGHIRACHFAATACRLFLCKNVRNTYKDIKNFEL